MARLNHPPDSPRATPAADRKSSPHADTSTVMSPCALQPLFLDASLQSHGDDSLPPSPVSSDPLSRADCRTLQKILSDVSNSSAPQTPCLSGLAEQQYLDDADAGVTFNTFTEDDAGHRAHAAHAAHHALGGEVTDAGYKDDDDSMELTEGLDSLTARSTSVSDLELASPSVSKSERRLQDSVPMHDEKDRQRYTSRRSWTEQYSKAKRREQQHKTHGDVSSDPITETRYLPRECAQQPKSPEQECGVTDPCLVPEDRKQQKQARLAIEKRIEEERLEQEQVASVHEGGVILPYADGTRVKSDDIGESELDRFYADGEDTTLEVTGPLRRKTWQRNAPKSKWQISSAPPLSLKAEETGQPSPNTPITEHSFKQTGQEASTNNQSIFETPFTKTLNYYKQVKDQENTPIKRRRNTALPKEIAEVTELAVDAEDLETFLNLKESQSKPSEGGVTPKTSALSDVQELVSPEAREDVAELSLTVEKKHIFDQSTEPAITNLKGPVDEDEVSTADDSKKQLILYPQHPPFVTAIGMIPATIFWVTAAPIVKYTNVTIEYLIDKLRDVYL